MREVTLSRIRWPLVAGIVIVVSVLLGTSALIYLTDLDDRARYLGQDVSIQVIKAWNAKMRKDERDLIFQLGRNQGTLDALERFYGTEKK